MPIYLFNLVASLREKNAKGYPVKKVCSPSRIQSLLNSSYLPLAAPTTAVEEYIMLLWGCEGHYSSESIRERRGRITKRRQDSRTTRSSFVLFILLSFS